MSTLNSSLLSLKSASVVAPPSPPPQAAVAQSKRFANIMAKVQTTTPQVAQAAPPAPAKPTAPDNGAPAGPHSEASRAEANARNNAKAAARAVAARALVKTPGSDVNRQTGPNVEPHTEPHIEPHQAAADGKSTAEGAALSNDMAAWLAALNPAGVNSAAAAKSQPGGDAAITEAELATQLVTQAAGQVVADKNTQVLREEAQADKEGDAQHGSHHGVAGQRTATDPSRLRAASDSTASDGAGSSGRDGQRSASREAREAADARATSRTTTELPANMSANMSANNAGANVMTMLSKEVTAASTTTATGSTDFSALMTSNMNAANGTSTTPDTVTLSLPTPVNAPEFREALGVQVSLLARDGVQTAELHLNPAEMGPVSIQIVMAGSQARVDFAADVAATRAAIEAGMPELASALRDAGFTLAGGGVSQHAKGQDTADNENRQGRFRRNISATTSSLATPAAELAQHRVLLTPGGVDLFA
jgi:flagellar hook-length control protein FliK